jgi:predicted transcriptional regulator
MTLKVGRCRLVEILAEIGWSQQDLADYSGLSKQVVSQYATEARIRMPLLYSVIIVDTIFEWTGRRYAERDLYVWIPSG